jgi:hypothetical protein
LTPMASPKLRPITTGRWRAGTVSDDLKELSRAQIALRACGITALVAVSVYSVIFWLMGAH